MVFGRLADHFGPPRGVDVAVAMTKPDLYWLVTMHQIGLSIDSVISAIRPRPGVLGGLRERLL